MSTLDPLIDDLVAANRILAGIGVLDGFGHVSARHPERADRYLLARSLAPELVMHDDVMTFDLASNPRTTIRGRPTSSASSTEDLRAAAGRAGDRAQPLARRGAIRGDRRCSCARSAT